MQRRLANLVVMLWAAAILLFLSTLAEAGPTVPYRDSGAGGITGVIVNPPFVTVQIAYSGQATHLGRFHAVGQHDVDFSTPLPSLKNGMIVLTAANGATMSGTYSGAVAGPPSGGFVTTVINATITGGTGRLTGVTGTLNATVVQNVVTNTFTISTTGVLNCP